MSELLANQEAVELVVIRAESNIVKVCDKNGIGVIDRITQGGKKLYRYRVVKGADPLGYSASPSAAKLMDGKYHDAKIWLKASIDTPHPDCVVQIIELTDSPRSGDIMLFARDSWDFDSSGWQSDRGGHGGILRHEIIVPWIWTGPGIPHGQTVTAARTVNLMPTMLELLGRADRIKIKLDGISIAKRLKQASGVSRLSKSRREYKIQNAVHNN